MTMETVETMFGADAVKLALDEPDYPDIDDALIAKLDAVKAKAGPGYLRSWALAQPWPVFCAIVRILSGEHARIKSMPRCALGEHGALCGRDPYSATTDAASVTCADCLRAGH